MGLSRKDHQIFDFLLSRKHFRAFDTFPQINKDIKTVKNHDAEGSIGKQTEVKLTP